MKRSFTYVLAAIVLFAMVISCSKDDPAAPSVVGTWKFISYVAASCTDPADEEDESCSGTLTECGSLVLTATTFTNTPGTLTGGSADTGTYAISGTTITITPNGGSAFSMTFSVTATTLTVSSEDSGTGCTTTTTFTRQ